MENNNKTKQNKNKEKVMTIKWKYQKILMYRSKGLNIGEFSLFTAVNFSSKPTVFSILLMF